jgi:hypothetical protein
MKETLAKIAGKEGRTVSQICEMMLEAGIQRYDIEGTRYFQRVMKGRKNAVE